MFDDAILGKTAVKLKWLTPDELTFCLQRQQQHKSAGQIISLANIMIDLGYVSAKDLQNFVDNPTLGRYKILQEIGRGGMGRVYKVYDPNLQRVIALKLLVSQGREAEKKRFLREAKTTAQLKHPNIINVYDFGIENQQYFFTMDFVDGITLHDLIDKRLSTKQIIAYMLKITEAIHYAHSQGVIHRDLKPANIVIDTNNVPIVMDFGLAKVSNESQKLSKTGIIMGTLLYMSPEQVDGKASEIDTRTDIYALGVILYELLTLHLPFSGNSTVTIMEKILYKPPIKLSNYKNTISSALENICLKCLEKEKGDRYTTVEELHEDLLRFQQRKKVYATLPSYEKKIPMRVVAIVLTTFVVCLSCFWYFSLSQKIMFSDLLHFEIPKIENSRFVVEPETGKWVLRGTKNTKYDISKIMVNDQVIVSKTDDFSYEIPLNYGKNVIRFLVFYNGNKWLEHTWIVKRKKSDVAKRNISFRNSSNTGFFDSKVIPRFQRTLWKKRLPNRVWSSPLVTESYVFVGSYDAKLYCLDRRSAKILWEFKAKGQISSTPAILGDVIYLCGTNGMLYAIDYHTGVNLWSLPLGAPIEASPVIVNNHLFVGDTKGKFYAIDLIAKKQKWFFQARQDIVSSACYYKNKICFGSFGSALHILNIEDGQLYTTFPARHLVYMSPAISKDGIVYFGDFAGYFYAYNIENLQLLWQNKCGGRIVASPAMNDNLVYCATENGVYCFDRFIGKRKWYFATPKIVETSPALTHNALFFGDFSGNFYIVNCNNGDLLTKLSTGASMTSSPFVKDNSVFFANYSGDVYAVKFSE
ncbi:PQQ-binding-like beta-propeller repeat protein [Candidatus Uabimicrobium sp. HlEnr_7]|uniref:protein kinase domain-containing protein n=1 Tax=Candidatus Uabimicrobium helgolandensis TaxID=3095367 RepID=UPI0035571F3D